MSTFNPDAARARAADAAYPNRRNDVAPLTLVPSTPVRVVGHDEAAKPQSTSWMAHGACYGNTAAMFPTGASNSDRYAEGVRRALAICASCTVIDRCREYAEDYRPADGIWAGQKWSHGHPYKTRVRKRPTPVKQDHTASGYSLLTLIESATWGESA